MKIMNMVLLVFIALVSCNEKKIDAKAEQEVVVNTTDDETTEIIQKILDVPKLQPMFHAEIADRLPIKLVANDFVSEELVLQKFDKSVRIATIASFEKEKIEDYLIVHELQVKSDTAYFELAYGIEGVQIKGKLVNSLGDWLVKEYILSEN